MFKKFLNTNFFIGGLLFFCFYPNFVLAIKSNDPFLEQWAYDEIGLYEAWNYTTGSEDVIVAIIDNGFDTLHPDLKDNVWINKGEIAKNNIDDDGNGFTDDIDGWNFFENSNNTRIKIEDFTKEDFKNGIFNHATYVAGIIGGVGNNNFAGSGLNWRVSLMNLKVVDDRGVGGLKQIEEAIYYAVNNGAHIINISIVGNDKNAQKSLFEAIDYAYEKGVLVVAAAGNDMYDLDESPRFPVCADKDSAFQKILGVSAINNSYRLAPFSNIGNCVDITAPGMFISSTLFFRSDLEEEKIFNGSLHGTSFATPFVSGAAALIKSINLDWTAKDLIEILSKSVHHTRGQDEESYKSLFGVGLLQIDSAIKYAIEKKSDFKKGSMLFISAEDGVYKKQNEVEDPSIFSQNELFKNIYDIKLTKINNEDVYIVFKKEAKNYEVLFFDLDLNFIKKIIIDFSGEADFSLVDLYFNSNPEIIVSPKFESNIFFKVFDLQARHIQTYKKDFKHSGSYTDTIKNIAKKDFISLVYKKDGHVFVEELDRNLDIFNSFSLEDFDFNDFILANADKDFEDEYIFSSVVGEPSKIVVVNNKQKVASFQSYTINYQGGFRMFLFDDGDDGKDELFLTAGENMPIKVFDFSGQQIKTWDSFSFDLFFIKTK